MTDPFDWPAFAGAETLAAVALHCEVGIWGKVHGQASDYRWIARTPGFGASPELHRYLRVGGEDLPTRASAWRAPWAAGAAAYFAVGLYPSRARDAAGRAAVLEKRVLRWCPPAGVPVALGALALLPLAAAGDDRCWWDRAGQGDWRTPDDALPLAAQPPVVTPGRGGLAVALAGGIADLTAALTEARLGEVYAALLTGRRPVLLECQDGPLSPGALAALLLPLEPEEAARCSLCAWVPATLVDPPDLGQNWDLAVVARRPRGPVPSPVPSVAPSPAQAERGARLAAALYARDPGLLGRAAPARRGPGDPAPVPQPRPPGACHPCPRLGLDPPDRPGLDALYRFADTIDRRRLDLAELARDLRLLGVPSLPGAPVDPDGHPLIGWIAALQARRPCGVEPADWGFKIDQLRAAALLLLPHPRTLDLVGLPQDPRVPALLAVLALAPDQADDWLAGHGEEVLRRLWAQTQACPEPALVAEIRSWGQKKSPAGSQA